MSGRVLKEEEINAYENKAVQAQWMGNMAYWLNTDILNLIATIRDLKIQLNIAWESKRVMAGQILDHEEAIRRLDKRIKERDETIAEALENCRAFEQLWLESKREIERLRGALFETLKCYGDPFNMTVDEWINHFAPRNTNEQEV